jgi:sugar lactone lactonase YvrE
MVLGVLALGGLVIGAQAQTASLTVTTTTLASGLTLNNGGGLCVDGSGNLYVAGSGNVYKLTLSNGVYSAPVTLLTGLGGLGGVSVDGAGNIYLAAYGVGEVTKYPYSASTGTYGAQIVLETGVAPSNIYVDGAGSVYFPNGNTNTIVKLPYANGVYGAPVTVGSGFNSPQGAKNDSAGNIYVADQGNAAVKKIPYSNGTYGTPISIGSGFTGPVGVVVDGSGNVFVADSTNVKEIPYSNGTYGTTITVGSGFNSPEDVAIDALGNVYEDDGGSGSIKEIGFSVPTFGTVTLGSNTTSTVSFTFITGGTIKAPAVLTQGATGLDFTDAGTGTCTTNGTAHTYAAGATCTVTVKFTPKATGQRTGAVELLNSSGAIITTELISGVGKGPLLTFNAPTGRTISVPAAPRAIAIDASGNVYDPPASNVLYKVTSAGVSTALYTGAAGANYAAAAVDGAGDVYIVDHANNVLVEVGPTGTLLRSVALGASSASGLGAVALGADGTAYVADPTDGKVITVTQLSVVGAIAVSGYTSGTGVAVDSAGVLYVTLGNSNSIAEILKGSQTNVTPTGTALNAPNSIAVDAAGDLFVTNGSNGIVVVTPAGVGTALTTTGLSTGFISGIALDGAGGLYFPDQNNGVVNIVNLAANTTYNFASTYVYSTSATQKLLLTNIGNAALTFPPPTTGSNPSIASGFVIGNTSTCPQLTTASSAGTLASGASCTDLLSFAPTVAGSYSGNILTTDNTLSVTGSTQSVALNGAGIAQLTKTINFPQPTTPAAVTSTATLTATASNGDPVTYTVTSGIASISGNVITFTNAGTVTIAANSAETPSTQAAPTVSQTVTVSPAASTYSAPTEPVGTASATQMAYVNITTAGTLGKISVVTQGNPSLDYKYVAGGTCATGTAYTLGQVCTVAYTFTPQSPGQRVGGIVLSTSAGAVLGRSLLSGTGTGPEIEFYPGTQTTLLSGLPGDAFGITVDASGNIYLANSSQGNLLKETLSGSTYTATTFGSGLTNASGVVVDGAGNVFFADHANNRVVEEVLNPVTGAYTQTPTLFSTPSNDYSLAIDAIGTLYVGSSNTLLKEVPNGSGGYTATTISSSFNNIIGLAVDASGNLYVGDGGAAVLYKETYSGGSYTLSTIQTGLSNVNSVVLDASGTVYVTADGTSPSVLRYAPNGSGYTALTPLGNVGRTNGVALDGLGNLYVTNDAGGNSVIKITVSTTPALSFGTVNDGSTSQASVQLTNIGNTGLTSSASGLTTGYYTRVTGSGTPADCGTGLSAGTICSVTLQFAPVNPASGSYPDTYVFSDNSANTTATQTVNLSGTAVLLTKTINFPALTSPVGVNGTATLAATASTGDPITYTVTSGTATISGSTITYTNAGSVTIAANSAASSSSTAAPTVSQTVTVNPAASAYTAPTEPVGTASATQTAYVNITTAGTLGTISVVTQGNPNLDFTYVSGGTCAVGTVYSVGQACSVEYSFKPTSAGSRIGAAVLKTSTGGVLGTSYISGIGTAPLALFTTATQTLSFTGLNTPRGLSSDGFGNLYEMDTTSGNVYEFAAGTGTRSTVASGYPTGGGGGTTVDGAGNVYFSADNFGSIYEIVNGSPVAIASLSTDDELLADGAGNLYASGPSDGSLWKVASGTHQLTNLLPSGLGHRFIGIGVDLAGDLFPADFNSNTLYELPAGSSTLVALVSPDGHMSNPHGVALDPAGNIYVTNYSGSNNVLRYAAGTYALTVLPALGSRGITIDGSGNLTTILNDSTIVQYARTAAPALTFPNTAVGSSSTGGSVTLENDGNAPLVITAYAATAGFSVSGSSNTCVVGTLAAGGTCQLGASFVPTAVGAQTGTATLTDNTKNVAGTQQTVTLTATATQGSQAITFTQPASPVTYGVSPIALVATGGASGNAVTFSILSGGAYGSISGNTLTVTGAGTIVIAANQAASTNYLAATQVTRTLVVNQASKSISFQALTTPVTVNATATLAATASNGDPVTYTVTSGTATISGTTLTYTNAGSVTIAANSAATANYLVAPTVSQTITVSAAPSVYSAPTEPVGTASATQTAYVNFTSAGTLGTISVLTQGATGLDFNATGGTCAVGTTYAVGQACSVTYTFTPKYPGQRIGGITLLSGTGTTLGSSYLNGSGTGPQAIFPATATKTNLGSTSYDMLGIAVDGNGNVFYVDPDHSLVHEITAASGYTSVLTIGSGFNQPYGIAVDGNGNVFVGDAGKLQVYELLASSGYVTVVPVGSGYGRPGQSGVAVDASGNLFVSDYAYRNVTERTAASGYTTVTTVLSGLNFPAGVAVDASGNVFVVDQGAKTVTEVLASGGYTTTHPVGSGYTYPTGITVDANGNVFVADGGAGIKEVLAAGGYTTVTNPGGAVFDYSIAQNGNGNLYLGDGGGTTAQLYNLTTPPSLAFGSLNDGSSSMQSFTIGNSGNAPLTAVVPGISGLTTGLYAQIAGSGTPADCTSSFSLASGATCNVSIKFAPVTPDSGAYADTYLLTDNNLNGSPSATQTVNLTGTAVQLTKTINFPQPTTPVNVTSSATLAATASNGDAVTYSVTSGTASIVGSTITYTTVGSVTIAANSAATSSTTAAPQVSRTVVVNQIPQAINFTLASPVTYGVSPIALVATGGASGNAVTFSIISGGAYGSLSGTNNSVLTVTGAGTIVIAANQAGSTNYSAATQVTRTVVVNPATLAASIIGNPTKVYNGTTAATLTSANYQLGGLVGADSFTVTQTVGAYAAATAGTQTVTATLTSSNFTAVSGSLSNYTLPASASGSGTISQASASVTPTVGTKTYGTTDPTLTGTLSGFVAADNVTATYSRVAGSNVGSYTISATLSPTAVLSNYNITYNTAAFTITPASASVTPNAATKVYGTADPTLSGTLTGFIASDNVVAAYSRAAGANVGSYAISAALSPTAVLTNYNVTYNTASFTITQASASVTPNAATKIFGTADPNLTGTLTGFLASDNVTAIYSRVAGENVGSYTISAALSPTVVLSNYSISYNTALFSITPATKSISFPALASPVTVNATATLAATASNGDPVTYTVTSGAATISGTTLTFTNAGSVTIAADSAATLNYLGAPTVSQTISVSAEPSAYTAPTTAVGVTSATQTAYVNITTAGTLNAINVLTKGSPNLDYNLVSGGTCTATTVYTVGQVCTVEYSFTPTAAGERIGGITLVDGSGNVLGSSYLGGIGTAPVGVFNSGTQSTVFNIGDGGQNGMTFDGAGDLYYTDLFSGTVYEVKVGTQTPIVIATGLGIVTDVAVDGIGDIFFGSNNQNQLFELKAGSTTPVLLDTPVNPEYFAVDAAGNLFVAIAGSQVVEEYLPNGTTATFGTGLVHPQAIALDSSDNIYLTDRGLNEVLEITPANVQTVLASGFGFPVGIAMDPAGNIYVADTSNNAIDMLAAGTYAVSQVSSGWNQPKPLFMDAAGNLYVGDTGSGTVIELNRSTASLGFPSTAYGTVSGAQQTTFVNLGNAPLTISALTASTNFQVDAANTCSVGSLASGANCVLAADFAPQAVGSFTGALTVTDNSLNQTNFAQTVTLSGTGVQQTAVVTVSPATISYATPSVTLTATVAYVGATAPTGSVTFMVEGMNPVVASCSGTGSPLTCTAVYPTATINAPHHGIQAVLAADTDYTSVTAYARLTVTPIAPTITFSVANHTYGDAPVTLAATSNSDGAITYSVVSGPATVSGTVLTITGAGAVTVQASQVSTRDYIAGTQNAVFNVAQAVFTVSIVGNPVKVYDGTTAATLTPANYQTSALVGTDVITVMQPVGSYAAAAAGPENVTAALAAGNFTATSGTLANYILPTSASGAGTITPASLTVTAGSYSGVYDGASHALSGCVVSANPDGLTCTNSPVGPVGPDVGGTAVVPVVSGPVGNYTVTTVNGAWSITAKPVTITAGSYSGTYDGAAHAPSACTSSYAGVSCADSPASVGPGAGSGTVTPVVGYVSGIAADYAVTSVNGSYAIAQAGSVTSLSCPASVVYNSTAQTPCTATVTGAGGLSQSVVVTYGSNTNVGTASASATFSGDANHTGSTKSTTFAVTPALLTVTAGSYSGVYDGASHALSGCVVNSNPDGLTCTNSPFGPVGPNVGGATVTPVVSGPVSNYSVTTVNGSWSITAKPVTITAGSYTGTYDGNAHAPSACVSSYAGVTCADSPASVGPGVGSGVVNPVPSYTSGNALDYTVTTVAGSFSITKLSASVTPNPATKVYGTSDPALSGTLSGFLAADGVTATYSRTSGESVGGSPYTVSATLSPAAVLANYAVTYNTANFTITKATPTVSWSAPSAITYGTVLSGTQLNAVASVAGTLTYTPAAGSLLHAGTQTLTVSFTPTDTTDYTAASGSVTLTVNQATPVVTWNTPASIVYGTALSTAQQTATATGIGGVSLPGSFFYTEPNGEVFIAGVHALGVGFTPTDIQDYVPVSAYTFLTVTKATPTITWAAPAAITYGTPLSGAQLNAVASVPGTLTYTPALGSVLHAGVQTLTVSFTPNDTTDYNPFSAQVTLTVNQATPVVTWSNPPSVVYGTATGTAQQTATANVPGSFFYTQPSGVVLKVGSYPLGVSFTPTDTQDYTSVSAFVTLTVTKATPAVTWPTPAAITYGTALSGTQLNATANVAGTFVYAPAAGAVLTAGTQTLSVAFTPADTQDYTSASATVALVVNKATPVITWPTPAAITYGTPLSGTQLNATANVAGSFVYTAYTGPNPLGVLLVPGTTALSATFTPADSLDYTSAVAYVVFTVSKAQTTTTLAVTTTQTVTGTTATLTATVKPQIGGTPTGTVTFYSGSTALGSAAIGTPFTTGVLPVGTDPITAVYSGDSNFNGSSSSASAVSSLAPSTVQLNPGLSSVFYPASSVSFTVIVPLKNLQLVSGTVTLYDGSSVIGTYSLPAGGVLVGVTPQLGVGTHNLRAVYNGNAQYPPGQSPIATVTVKAL